MLRMGFGTGADEAMFRTLFGTRGDGAILPMPIRRAAGDAFFFRLMVMIMRNLPQLGGVDHAGNHPCVSRARGKIKVVYQPPRAPEPAPGPLAPIPWASLGKCAADDPPAAGEEQGAKDEEEGAVADRS